MSSRDGKSQIITEIRRTIDKNAMLNAGDHIIVALSGGADSVCLLVLLCEIRKEYGFEVRAVHVHHGLRKTADRDEQYVRDLCSRLGTPLAVHRVRAAEYASQSHMSVEEAGRALRITAFDEELTKWKTECGVEDTQYKIALAHHMEDSAETVLFNLCRGSSLSGMCGIRPVSGNRIRPLIDCTKQEITGCLKDRGIAWCEDETNTDTDITRNMIRLRIMPELTGYVNNEAAKHITDAASDMQEAEEYLRAETIIATERCSSEPGVINVKRLLEEPVILQKRVLYEALVKTAGRKKDIEHIHIENIMAVIRKGGSAKVTMPYGIMAVKEYDDLRFTKNKNGPGQGSRDHEHDTMREAGHEVYAQRVFAVDGMLSKIPDGKYTKWFDYDRITSSLVLRTREKGDYITLSEDGKRKMISRFMIDEKIAPRDRDLMIMPADGSEILWIPGYRISARYRISETTKNILEITLKYVF